METATIRELVARHAPTDGMHPTPLEGVQIFRLSQPVERLPAVYSPSLCIIVQGSKRAYLGGETHVYDDSRYLCATMPMPVETEVPCATKDEPLLGLLVSLETRAMAEIVVEYEANVGPTRGSRGSEVVPGLVVAEWRFAFGSALESLLELLDDPVSLGILGHGRLRELLFAVIQGEGGSLIRRSFGTSHRLSRSLSYLRENLDQPMSVDDLAKRAGMSRAVFDRQFRAATTFSPLQFAKALKLNEAAMQIARGVSISQAATSVGYSSPSQFSREFRRQYGAAPRQWGKMAAGAAVDPQSSAIMT
jgi:AraC-like DNA-binding protein